MFSAALRSSPKWIVCSWSCSAYTLYMASPPGKELWLLARVADCTSQGKSRDVIDMTVSSAPLMNCPAAAGKASIESYGAPTSSAKASRFIMLFLQSPREAVPPESWPVAKNLQLPPATYCAHAMSRIT